MRGASTWLACLVLVFGAALLLPLQAQEIPDQLLLSELAQPAGLIFSGTVLAVEHVPPATENGVATVRVTFRVREGVRGVRNGERLTITEWGGLWTGGERYRVGETLLLFLYAPSGELGLTSPVGGERGRIRIQDEPPVQPRAPAKRASNKQVLRALRRAVQE